MKKYYYMVFGVLGLMMSALASCNSPMDENPVPQTPSNFVLNTPALANQYIELTPTGTVNLTCSQPDYGYSAIADYYAQVSLTESFTDFVEVTAEPLHSCDMQVPASEIAEGVCKLRGVTSEDNYTDEDARKVYVRLRACVNGAESYTTILSNVVCLNQVKGYFALKLPGFLYLVGKPEGWTGPTSENKEHYESWKLLEADDAIGSKIYTGEFEIAAGEAQFRFYSALTGWDDDSYGIQAEDNPLDVAMTDGVFLGSIVKGKGSYNIPDWTGGKMKIEVNMSNAAKMTVKFTKVD